MIKKVNNILLFLFVIFETQYLILAGVVRPFTSYPIIMSSTNSGVSTDYNFTIQLDTHLPTGGTMEIKFPKNQYIAGLGMSKTPNIYVYTNGEKATIASTVVENTLIIPIGETQAK